MIYREFLDNGYKIFGLNGITKDGKCKCGDAECTTILKHPLHRGWQNTPEWSDEQLEAMEARGDFNTGYGVLVDELLIVDVDARNGGVESYSRLLSEVPELAACAFMVETGSGNGSKHLYFRLSGKISLHTKLNDYKGIDFKSSGYVVGPGSLHVSKNKYKVLFGSPSDVQNAPASLIKLLERKELHRASIGSKVVDIADMEIANILSYIRPDCDYEAWVKIGMSLHDATKGAGFYLWDNWSAPSGNYPGTEKLEQKWHSFGKCTNPVTIGTLFYYAKLAGWEPVNNKSIYDAMVSDYDDETNKLPCDISGVDLLRPPGFVGEVCSWINNQCIFKRENLAVAAALVSIGNIGGLRYIDDITGITPNLFAFCVADSSTGKESILQAAIGLHVATGISSAVHGGIKSEQEIVRNLIRNQAAFYLIDELGLTLQKIINSQTKGGASYLEGVIGKLMEAYSKANGYFLVTGDLKDELLEKLNKALEKAENKGDDVNKAIINESINNINRGIKHPFLSLLGFSTGSTFNGLCTADQAQSGFIGRSLLINELETNPKPKAFDFKKEPMSLSMILTLKMIFGSQDDFINRVEFLGIRTSIPTTDNARMLMEKINHWLFHVYAEKHKEYSMEAIVRRGYELMLKISLILAIPGGIRTDEHIVWAFAMMKRDIDAKVRLVYINSVESKDSLVQKIMTIISTEHAESLSIIANRCRPQNKADVAKTLLLMEEKGKAIKIMVPHKLSKTKIVEKWQLVK